MIMQNSIRSDMNRYQGKIRYWNVVNEYSSGARGDAFLQKIGADYIDIAFETARETDHNAILIYNDYSNHTINGQRSSLTKQIVNRLTSRGLIDMVGLETILFWPDLPTKEELIAGMKQYGIPIIVTEFNVNMGAFSGSETQKFLIQAQAYYDALSACLESGSCKGFIMFLVSDAANFWNSQTDLPGASPNNDPSPFDRNFRPKPAYYAARMALLDYLISIQK